MRIRTILKEEPEDVFIRMPENTRFPQLMKALGFFPSAGEARRNGWNKDIEHGWTDIMVGKMKKRICILKMFLEKPQ